ncbi:MAG: arsenate reductase (glutaredoxin) [Bacteroidales bacterium]|nr:arsenate reductase (glutaredoxin) [Bacteroidales bacterium]
MLTIYHNPKCRKSRAGLDYLKTKNVEFTVVEYIKEGISIKDLKEILLRLNKKAEDIVRTHEEMYKKELKNKKFTQEEWLKILVDNPKLIQRPLVVGKHKAVLAQPPEEINTLL